MKLTKELIHFLHELRYEELPEDVIDRTKFLLLDYLGVALAGSRSDSSRPVYKMIQGQDAPGPCTVIGQNFRVLPGYAALANGTGAHSLELDDIHQPGSIHLGVVIFSSAIAASEACRKIDGKQFITSVVAGYEAAARLAIALQPQYHYRQGFHPTATCGTFGATVTVSKLLGLGEKQMLAAFGIAGSMAAGSMEFLTEGTWTKRLHAGLAAQNGWQAASLAVEGFQGPATILEGRNGFLAAYSGQSIPELVTQGLGDSFEVLHTSVKPHACCRYKQAPIDAIIELGQEHEITADQVKSVQVAVLEAGFPLIAEPLERKYAPSSVVDAQFSMPFGAAVALLYRRASLDEYREEKLKSPQVRDLMKRISMVKDPALEKNYPAEWPARVVIELQDGQSYEKLIRFPKGDPENPLSWEELNHKFRSLAGAVFPAPQLEEIRRATERLDQSQDTCATWRMLAG